MAYIIYIQCVVKDAFVHPQFVSTCMPNKVPCHQRHWCRVIDRILQWNVHCGYVVSD